MTKSTFKPKHTQKVKRPRDYKAEYAARIARAEALAAKSGVTITRSQARGHARTDKSEASIKSLQKQGVITTATTSTLSKYDAVVKRMNAGESLTAATKAERMSPATFKKAALKNDILAYHNKKIVLHKREFRIITSDSVIHNDVPLDRQNASTAGRYWDAIAKSQADSGERLATFTPPFVDDIFGNRYELLLDYEKLAALEQVAKESGTEALTGKIYRAEKEAA
jgi:hypothetical protein